MTWLLCRLNNEKQKLVPAWSAFQEITTMKPRLCGVNVIPHPPTKFETIYMILQSGYDYMKKLELEYIFIECDQAVYHKILEVKFNLLRDRGHDPFEGIIVRMGGFHVLMCLMKTIYSRFKGFGLTELLAEVGGLGGTGTIDNALKGGDVKAGIRLYKLLFEAVYRIKLRNKVFTNGENELTQQISNAKQNMNMQKIDILMKNPR